MECVRFAAIFVALGSHLESATVVKTDLSLVSKKSFLLDMRHVRSAVRSHFSVRAIDVQVVLTWLQ